MSCMVCSVLDLKLSVHLSHGLPLGAMSPTYIPISAGKNEPSQMSSCGLLFEMTLKPV